MTGVYLLLGKDLAGNDLWQDEQRDQPTPSQELQVDIVPHRHKRKHNPDVVDRVPCATQRDVNVAQDPEVVTLVPAAPESQCRVIVGHTPDHVLGRLNAVHQGPEPEEAPNNHQLEPDKNQVEESNHTDLKDWVIIPGLAFTDRHHVHVVHAEFHGQQAEHESSSPHGQCLCLDLLGESQLLVLSK